MNGSWGLSKNDSLRQRYAFGWDHDDDDDSNEEWTVELHAPLALHDTETYSVSAWLMISCYSGMWYPQKFDRV